MNGKRIVYLDQVKGFAIFLMVFAHVLAWNYGKWDSICILRPDSTTKEMIGGFLWQIIYAFHMPLFFVVSGLLTPPIKQNQKVNQYLQTRLIKRIQRLLIPYFATGFILYFLRGHYGYWFLLSLFELTFLGILFYAISNTINSRSSLIQDLVILFFIFISLKFLSKSISLIENTEIVKFINYYPSFFLGILMRKHFLCEKILNKRWTELLGIGFVLLFCLQYLQISNIKLNILHPILSLRGFLMPLIGSLFVMSFFKNGVNGKIGNVFDLWGQKSMEIYVFHIIFAIQIPLIGQTLLQQNMVTCITSQIIVFSLISLIAIYLSLICSKVLNRMPIIRKIITGS